MSASGGAVDRNGCRRHNISRETLTLHADRGGPMVSKTVSELLCDLGVARSHSRPHVSNDNPFSEAQFYAPEFPGHSIEEAREFCAAFLTFYNTRQHGHCVAHAGNGSHGKSRCRSAGAAGNFQAYAQKPGRFSKGSPKVLPLHEQVCIRVEPQPAEVDPKVH